MLKANRKLIILSCIICLLPILFGLSNWDALPESIATHFGPDGNPDGYSSKFIAVVGLPVFICIVNLVCAFTVSADPKKKNISPSMFRLVLGICPLVSLFCAFMTYAQALGYKMDVNKTVFIMIGVLFMVLGSFLPECKQNYTIGIRVPWTLADEEVWDKTHKIGAISFIAGGLLCIIDAFIGSPYLLFAAIIIAVMVPVIYSFVLYKKKEGRNE